MFDKGGRQFLAGFAARPTLAPEIIARLLFCELRAAMPFVLPMLVHPLEPKWYPAAAGLEMSNLKLGEFLEDAVGAEVKTGEHLFQRMAGDVAAELAVTVRAGLFEHGARAFVNTERHAQVRRDLIDGEVVRAGKSTAAEFIWPPEDAHQTKLLFRELQLFDGPLRILQRNERYAVETLSIVTAVVGQPAVVGAADGGAELRVEVAAPHDIKTKRRKQHADVDAFAVHVAHVRCGIEFCGQRLREGLTPTLRTGESKPIVFLLFDRSQFVGIGNRLAVNETKRLVWSFDAHTISKLRGQIIRE